MKTYISEVVGVTKFSVTCNTNALTRYMVNDEDVGREAYLAVLATAQAASFDRVLASDQMEPRKRAALRVMKSGV